MAKIESPIGIRHFSSTSEPPMRNFVVPDATANPQAFQPPFPPSQGNTPLPQSPNLSPADLQRFAEYQEQLDMQNRPPVQVHGNPSMNQADMEMMQQIQSAKKAQMQGKQRLSEGARKRIEMLLGMTRLSRTVDINGTSFTLQTLKSVEFREALTMAMDFDGTIQFPFESARQVLARSLTHIGQLTIEDFLSSHDLMDKLDFIQQLPQALFKRLHDEITDLNNEADHKYGLTKPEVVSEVLDDLKK